jgi:hypothetical protein
VSVGHGRFLPPGSLTVWQLDAVAGVVAAVVVAEVLAVVAAAAAVEELVECLLDEPHPAAASTADASAPPMMMRADPITARKHNQCPMARHTHHKHSSSKGYRRLLDRLAAHEAVHRVATGRVKPRMGTGRPIAPISKIRRVDSGLSITINADGAVIDAYVVTDRPDEVAAFMRSEGWAQ